MAMSVSRRPFRARRAPGRHLGFRRSGSSLGYNPDAASRLQSPDGHGCVRFSPRTRTRCRFLPAGPAPCRGLPGD